MFCAFDGGPRIVRLHGAGAVLEPGTPAFDELCGTFPHYAGTRSIITATISRISDSCGFSVPRLDFVEDRDALERWAEKKGPDGLAQYRRDKNASSIDGLPALTAPNIEPM